MASLQDVLMMNGPGDVTTGDIMANAPQKSVWRMLMEAAQGAQGQMDRVPWYVQAPFQPMLAPLEGAINTVRTGASGAENIRRGSAEDDPMRIAGGVGEVGLAGLSVLPATGALGRMLMGSAPRAMGTMGTLMGASMLPGVADARDRREGEIGAMQGPAHLTQELTQARQQLQDLLMQQRQINEQHKRSGPETQRRALAPIEDIIKQQTAKVGEIEGMIRAHAEQEHAKVMAERPLRERSPEAVQALTIGGAMLAGGLPFANTLKTRASDYLRGQRMNALADDVITGTIGQGRSRPAIADTAVSLGQLRDAQPTLMSQMGDMGSRGVHALGNSAKGAMIMGEASALPEQLDYLTYAPGHPTREAAAQSIRNPDYWKDRLAPAALGFGLGTMGQGLGHLMTPGSPVNQSRINTALGITKPQFREDIAALQSVRDAVKNPRSLLPPEPPVGPSGVQSRLGATQEPGRLPPPTGPQGTQPVPPRGDTPSEGLRPTYGPRDKEVARPRIESEIRGGNKPPTFDEMQQYLNKQLPESAKDKFTNLERMVLDLRATGRSDDEIATLLSGWMNSGKFNLPAVAAGTMGLGSMQFGDEPPL